MTEPAYPQTCPTSKFKDDRRDWLFLMAGDTIYYSLHRWYFVLQKCTQCDLRVLLLANPDCHSPYSTGPMNADIIVHTFYRKKEAK